MGAKPPKQSVEKLLILVVHGIGEQRRFDQIEAVAANFFKALKNDGRDPVMQVHLGDHAPRGGPDNAWHESAVTIRWRKKAEPSGAKKRTTAQWMEATFREVYWADLGVAMNFRSFCRFAAWALSMSGVHFFTGCWSGMYEPKKLSLGRRLRTRVKLFAISFFFLILLGTTRLLDFAFKRVSLKITPLERSYSLIFDYLGDVKLYQDRSPRMEDRSEVVHEKPRIGVRRRMVRAVLQTASEALADEQVRGYYIFAHSLGTIVAFNALMEPEAALANYLTEREWQKLNPQLKKTVSRVGADLHEPERPGARPWLAGKRHAVVDRAAVFRKFGGFLTCGSPLDRFAALWPALVPINVDSAKASVPWVNVYDVQDPVAGGKIRLIESRKHSIGGFAPPQNLPWPDSTWFVRAHTSYWRAEPGRRRVIDAIVDWLEGRPFAVAAANTEAAGAWRRNLGYVCAAGVLSAYLVSVLAVFIYRGVEGAMPMLQNSSLFPFLVERLKTELYAASFGPIATAVYVGVVLAMTIVGARSLMGPTRHWWYAFSLTSVSLFLLALFATLMRLLAKLIVPYLSRHDFETVPVWLQAHFIDGPHTKTVPFIVLCSVGLGLGIVLICAVARWFSAWENATTRAAIGSVAGALTRTSAMLRQRLARSSPAAKPRVVTAPRDNGEFAIAPPGTQRPI